nr:response regulator [Nitrospinaceae bacterium]NIR56139.1 response regulator [Nitrospinaceae bacterium]NIS86594.1 response regulator [Nitrospinaceae bacterium]NIT83424.1 response regulator [Nitrospinaceae bacterium]NIU45633.1 response regulator [Nitrospinaceae bacterium]
MKSSGCPIDIVLAEDDEDDVLLFREAWDEVNLPHRIHWVKDGEELLQCLLHPESVGIKNFRPRLIFLDLN